MFSKLKKWLSDEPPRKPPPPRKKQAGGSKKPARASQSKSEDTAESLIQQAILEAKQTLAYEEKIAGHDPDHLDAVQSAMMIYRQKQESLGGLTFRDKAKLRALGEAMFNGELSEASKKDRKSH
ncbi:MAG: hypothetical protein R3261_01260 [Alphaproteobacteria bacterium]|nr:hypothetical protein [Alphaproteobacteria bacterium]